jgi:hypothetical protein
MADFHLKWEGSQNVGKNGKNLQDRIIGPQNWIYEDLLNLNEERLFWLFSERVFDRLTSQVNPPKFHQSV